MVYLALMLLAYSSLFSFDRLPSATDSVRVFDGESYLELDPDDIFIRNMSTAFNPEKDHLYVYDKNPDGVLWEFKPDGSISVLDTLDIPEVHKMMPMDVSHSGESLLLWEQGLGKVFEYSFSDSTLQRVDQTRVQDLMVGHGSVITKDQRLLAQGGYGFWEYRNFLIEFNKDSGEWNKIEVAGDIPVKPYTYNFLGYMENENRLIYICVPLSSVEEGSAIDVHTFEPFFEIYTFNLNTNRWTHRNSIFPEDKDLAFNKRPRSRPTHSMDYSRGNFVFNGRLTLDIHTYDLFYISHPSVDDLRSANFYYSQNSDRWIVFGQVYHISNPHMVVRSFPAAEAQLTPVQEELPAHTLWLGWFLGGFVSLVLVFLGVYKWKNRSQEEDSSSAKKIELTEKNGELSAVIGGDSMDLSDPIFKEFFAVVYNMKEQGKSEILMSEFDNKIFSDHHSQPHRSKVKKKIFKLVNTKFDQPVITIDVYPLDKRYKMIVMNLNAVNIQTKEI